MSFAIVLSFVETLRMPRAQKCSNPLDIDMFNYVNATLGARRTGLVNYSLGHPDLSLSSLDYCIWDHLKSLFNILKLTQTMLSLITHARVGGISGISERVHESLHQHCIVKHVFQAVVGRNFEQLL